MIRPHGKYEISDDLSRIEFDRVTAWLAGTYWSPGITREKVERKTRHSSLVVGAYLNNQQVGFLRIVSDKTEFAWVSDVYVDEPHRNQGIARAMVRFALEHPEHQDLKRWMLATGDAFRVYESAGFKPVDDPAHLMVLRPRR